MIPTAAQIGHDQIGIAGHDLGITGHTLLGMGGHDGSEYARTAQGAAKNAIALTCFIFRFLRRTLLEFI